MHVSVLNARQVCQACEYSIVHICIMLRHAFRWKAAAASKTTLNCSPPASQQANINEEAYIVWKIHSFQHDAPPNTTTPPQTLRKRNYHASPPLAQALQTQKPRDQSPPPREREKTLHHYARRLQPLERNGFRQRLD